MKICFKFKTVSVTISGDYYQVMFHDGLDTDNEPYFMIQTQFEFPDGGVCYFGSHKENLIEHCKAMYYFLQINCVFYTGRRSLEMWKLILVWMVLIFKN